MRLSRIPMGEVGAPWVTQGRLIPRTAHTNGPFTYPHHLHSHLAQTGRFGRIAVYKQNMRFLYATIETPHLQIADLGMSPAYGEFQQIL